MRPEDRDAALLWDMLEAAKDIRDFVEGVWLIAREKIPSLIDALSKS